MCDKTDEEEAALGVAAPVKLNDEHDVANFESGQPSLDDFLKERARKNAKNSATVTYVACCDGTNGVAGYFSLATGAVMRGDAPKNIARNMPREIPVIVLGRLAVDRDYQGTGLGSGLLAEAIDKSLSASEHIGVRALLVHAIDENAAGFYQANGFVAMPHDPLVLMLSLKRAAS